MIYVMVDVLVVPFEEGGEIYYYEIDPRTGYPSCTGVNSDTVTAPNCTDADVLATAPIIVGEKFGDEGSGMVGEKPTSGLLLLGTGTHNYQQNTSHSHNGIGFRPLASCGLMFML